MIIRFLTAVAAQVAWPLSVFVGILADCLASFLAVVFSSLSEDMGSAKRISIVEYVCLTALVVSLSIAFFGHSGNKGTAGVTAALLYFLGMVVHSPEKRLA